MEGHHTVINWVEQRITRIADSYAPDLRVLAALRIAFGVWVVIFPINLAWIPQVPAEFFHPRPGAFFFLSTPPPEGFLFVLTAITTLLGVLLAAGVWTIPVSVALSVALITGSGISYSFSKVDHFILFELAPIFLSCAGWGRAWSVDSYIRRRRKRDQNPISNGMPVLLYAMTIGWAMLSAAVPKVIGGWLDFDRQASRGQLARDIIRDEKPGPLGSWIFQIDNDAFWKFLDYATLVAEGGLIFVVFMPLIFRLWLLLLAGFHVGVFLTLGISFVDYIFVYAVFFSPVFVWIASRAAGTTAEADELVVCHANS
ncbi:MAG: hypothetical protein WBB07_20645 [Mycobacterium sp.]